MGWTKVDGPKYVGLRLMVNGLDLGIGLGPNRLSWA